LAFQMRKKRRVRASADPGKGRRCSAFAQGKKRKRNRQLTMTFWKGKKRGGSHFRRQSGGGKDWHLNLSMVENGGERVMLPSLSTKQMIESRHRKEKKGKKFFGTVQGGKWTRAARCKRGGESRRPGRPQNKKKNAIIGVKKNYCFRRGKETSWFAEGGASRRETTLPAGRPVKRKKVPCRRRGSLRGRHFPAGG